MWKLQAPLPHVIALVITPEGCTVTHLENRTAIGVMMCHRQEVFLDLRSLTELYQSGTCLHFLESPDVRLLDLL
jgi:hypothetical protein